MTIVSKLSICFAVSAVLLGCNHSDDENSAEMQNDSDTAQPYRYEITVKNLTANQPFSPVVVINHAAEYTVWQAGEPASISLEKLAEGGDTTDMIQQALDMDAVYAMGSGIIKPGEQETMMLQLDHEMMQGLSVVTMLVNTNDAFTGINGQSIQTMAIGDSKQWYGYTWDAGTEDNTESMGTIPGPADGGEGFNSARSVHDFVAIHNGVVSQDDGLMTSVLNESHRFQSVSSQIILTRVE